MERHLHDRGLPNLAPRSAAAALAVATAYQVIILNVINGTP
jgi:hypothetical protein